VTIDPEGSEANELRNWWSTEGSTAEITPLGQVRSAVQPPACTSVGEQSWLCLAANNAAHASKSSPEQHRGTAVTPVGMLVVFV
jgi:hypothetical protein